MGIISLQVIVFCLSCFVGWSLVLSAAAPTSTPRQIGVVAAAPQEQCFDETCNRVTHYCDQVIKSCASCADDCHPSRISDDEQEIEECQRVCDWYYYVKSLNERIELTHAEKHTQTEAPENVAVHKYYVTVIVVLVACFTIIVIFILATFACYIKRQSTRPLVVTQETRRESLNRNIYKPYNLENTPSVIDPKNSSNETSLKLLSDYDNPSLEVRTGQQESIRQSNANRSAILHSECGPSQSRPGKFHSAQVNRNNASLPRSQEDLSIQPLVKSLQ